MTPSSPRSMACPLLPKMRLAVIWSPTESLPITSTPFPPFPRATAPVASVPILLPATTLPSDPATDRDAVISVAGDHVPFIADRRAAVRVDPDPVGRGALGEEDTVAGDAQGMSPGHVGPDEVARDDVAVGPAAVDVDAIIIGSPRSMLRSPTSSTLRPSVPIRLPEAPAGRSPRRRRRCHPGNRVTGWVPLFTGRRSPVMSVPMKLPATALPSVPWPVIQMPANRLPLSRFRSAASLTPSPLVPMRLSLAPASISTPSSLGSGLRAGRVGAQEVAIDPVAGRAGARDVDAGALAEIVDVQAADGDVRRGDQQAVAAAGLAAAQLDQRRAASSSAATSRRSAPGW